jgi:bacterioferritin (cytochrome b1)
MMDTILAKMNQALGFELRAINMYAHYAANVKGIHRMQLTPLFEQEITESLAHANLVRAAIVKLGGICVTERNSLPIVHTNSYIEMLEYSLSTEMGASQVYREVLDLVEKLGDSELYDSFETIYFSELRSVEEMRMLID